MSEANTLHTFELPYLLSIICGTMPLRLELSSSQKEKFRWVFAKLYYIPTVSWLILVSIFLYDDIRTIVGLTPYKFFSMIFIRLIHSIQTWMVLVTFTNFSRNLPKVVENLRSIGRTQRNSILSIGRKELPRSIRRLTIFYIVLITCPISYELCLRCTHQLAFEYDTLPTIQFRYIMHCVLLSINLQFCSFCIILRETFDDLNQRLRILPSINAIDAVNVNETHSTYCRLVRHVDRIYKWPIFADICIITVNVLLHTFYALKEENIVNLGAHFLWIAHFIGRHLTICILASSMIEKSKETSKFILLVHGGNENTNDNFDEITALVNRIGNRDTNFDICGFFRLDGGLFISICQWCISFILIILQFRKPT